MITEILLAFSQHVPKEEITAFIDKAKETYTEPKNELQIYQIIQIEAIYEHSANESLLVTDIPQFFDKAYEANMAGVAYLHNHNKIQGFKKASYAVMGLADIDYAYLKRVYERFWNLPWTIFETKRCVVREMTLADLDALYEIYEDKSITRFMEDLYEDKEEEKAYMEKYIHNMYGFYGFGMWMVQKLSDGKLIGRAGLSVREGYEDVELGYVIRKDEQGKGYAKEVCEAILGYAANELEAEQVNAFVAPDNLVSKRLCEKLGFVREGEKVVEEKVHDFYVWRKRK